MRKSFRFLIFLFAVLLVTFAVHLLVLNTLEKPLFEHKIILSYVVNFILAGIILLVVQRTLKKKSSQSGFIFMAGSGLKFLIFFLVFYPAYNADGAMQTIEFVAFFVPYAVCLGLEVAYLSKQLNNQEY
ncbi:DUF6168 family protein [Marixanthomonas spongiae]|uniref:Uncharacterized protein n=1 Tax=Marixanthomonas spongiae TaxID=2174845 RepID=A0A2U0I1Y3_9FLAO|nr:DUF6168 family protein [Marixanthomonas spongiae]PVW15113.1 hypothetical protein DDV96_06810 [Marixanthomonas spongiae]